MCMSVKKIQERISTAKNEVLEKKLQDVSNRENIDNYALHMVSDSYGFGVISAISGIVLGFVKLQEGWCELTKEIVSLDLFQSFAKEVLA